MLGGGFQNRFPFKHQPKRGSFVPGSWLPGIPAAEQPAGLPSGDQRPFGSDLVPDLVPKKATGRHALPIHSRDLTKKGVPFTGK